MRTDSRSDPLLPWVLGLVGCWAIIRIAFAFVQTDAQIAFGHDSAYLWIVARNVWLGLGFVNDAHWLVFLHPETLPVPFHNAAPLFSWLTAKVAATGLGPTTAGYLINALGSVALVGAVGWLLRAFGMRWSYALSVGLMAAVYLPVSRLGWVYGTNALTILFAILCLAAVARHAPRHAWGAGIAFGLAWLTRGDVILILPGVLFYYLARDGWGPGTAALARFGAAAAVTASPWLIHSWRVWGSPLRSDSSYYLIQDFVAVRQRGTTVWEFWHSPEIPPGLLEVVASDPVGFVSHTLRGVPSVILNTLGDWSFVRWWAALPLAVLAIAGTFTLWRSYRRELYALALMGAAHVGLWAIRNLTYETRYFSILAVLFAVVCSIGFVTLAQAALRRGVPRFAVIAVEVTLIGWLVLLPGVAGGIRLLSPNPELRAYTDFYTEVQARTGDDSPVVVGDKPYYLTQRLLRPSLSIPSADDAFLLEYMRTFDSGWVALTDEELDFWHPDWRNDAALPPFLERVEGVEGGHLFRRIDPGLERPDPAGLD